MLLVLWGKSKGSWGSWFNLQLCSSAGFSRTSASATETSSLLTSAPVPPAPSTCLCPFFFMAFSHALPKHLYFSMMPVILFRPISLPGCSEHLSSPFLVFLCLTNVFLWFPLPSLVSRKEAKYTGSFLFTTTCYWSSGAVLVQTSEGKNNWVCLTAAWATTFETLKFGMARQVKIL